MFLLSFVLLLPNALLLFVSLSNTPLAFSTAINCSIDDTRGDSVTGEVPTYLPTTSGVWEDTSCPDCFLNPPTSNAFMGTYKAATYRPYKFNNMSITFKFTGTAIYIFFILANAPPPGFIATTAANFTLDGSIVGTFGHGPDPTAPDFQFNALVFSAAGLENATHEMVISTSGLTDEKIWVNFDYALYTSVPS
ncbi:hypothetical protein GYMLUDRAFT_164227 [Collybiopsis luxurians FD-317 M1]|uniref:Uncharacterized protein n=1 Tax=Collybiopsis luxurians FD-317 M1 TaxID=944289 RepID=A0A0D0D1B9_9AGAR|nr:hypothetical protein GYMLUDRAFT_164227 [Collybiopsis luxurians FD-317 M1]